MLGSPASFMTDVFSSTAIKERRQKDSHWIPVRDDEKSGSEVERREEEKGRGVFKKKQLEEKRLFKFPQRQLGGATTQTRWFKTTEIRYLAARDN